jgi:outer membrane protein OmpA-like peptidoglycan-associated protein
LFAQEIDAEDRLPYSGFNYERLNDLIKLGIDSVRKSHGVKPLLKNKILFSASLNHAEYLDKNKILSHYQEDNKKLRSPHLRVQHYGGSEFTMSGENVAVTYAFVLVQGKKEKRGHRNLTYKELAHNFVDMWVHSPGHFRNIITKEFTHTGVATLYNSSDNSVRAVQVFGTLPNNTEPQSEEEFRYPESLKPRNPPNPISKMPIVHTHSDVHQWNIKDGSEDLKACEACMGTPGFTKRTKLYFRGNEVRMYSEDVAHLKKILNNRHDGFALEFVVYRPYACGNDRYYTSLTRRNKGCIFNGVLSKPVYGKNATSGFVESKVIEEEEIDEDGVVPKKKRKEKKMTLPDYISKIWRTIFPPFEPTYFDLKIGEIPKGLKDYYEVNLLVIQKGKLCQIIRPTGYCGANMEFLSSMNHLEPEFTKEWIGIPAASNQSLMLTFEKNKYDADATQIIKQLNSIVEASDKIMSVKIKAFSSVEGSKKSNEQLHLRRAKAIVDVIQKSQLDTLASEIRTEENWGLMHKQIAQNRRLKWLEHKTDDEIETLLLNEDKLKEVEPFLSKQRYAQLDLRIMKSEKPKPTVKWIAGKGNAYIDKIKRGGGGISTEGYKDSLRALQNFEYSAIASHTLDVKMVDQWKIPNSDIFAEFLFRNAWIQYTFSKEGDKARDSLLFRQLSQPVFRKAKYFPADLMKMKLGIARSFFKYKDRKEIIQNLKLAERLLKNSPDSLRQGIQDGLLSMHMKALAYFHNDGIRVSSYYYESLNFILKYWNSTPDISDSTALQVCNYLIFMDANTEASMFIRKFAMKECPMPEILMQAIKLSYAHPDNELAFPEYREWIFKARDQLTKEQWCSMFVGPCNISFQIWDDVELRKYYCKECAGYVNYAESTPVDVE